MSKITTRNQPCATTNRSVLSGIKLEGEINWLEILYYKEGSLFWKKKPYKSRVRAGDEVGGGKPRKSHQYKCFGYNNYSYNVHRIVWVIHDGPIDSDKEVDHINGITTDNRIENLRLASKNQNNQNRISKSGISKYKGVHFMKAYKGKKWRASIGVGNKTNYLGTYYTEKEAALAYNSAALRLHGNFAKLNEVTIDN